MGKKIKISKYIRTLDAFGQPVKLFIKGKDIHKTSTGGLITILIFAILIFLLVYSMLDLFNRSTMTTQEQIQYDMNPPLLNFTRDNFMFSIGVQSPNITLNNSLFSYTCIFETITNQNGIQEIERIPIELAPCKSSDYDTLVDYNDNYLSQMLCPQDFSLPIQGSYTNEIFKFIKLSITKCINGSNADVICAPDQDIQNYFDNTNKVELVLYFVNKVIDPYNLQNPFISFIDSQLWILSPLGTLARATDLYFRYNNFHSYDNLIGTGDPNLYTATTFAQDRLDNIYIPSKNSVTYVDIYLRSGNYIINTTRTYGTLLQVLSFIGGIWNVLYLGLGSIAAQINNHVYKVKMANIMYDFDAREFTNNKDQFNSKNTPTPKTINGTSNLKKNKVGIDIDNPNPTIKTTNDNLDGQNNTKNIKSYTKSFVEDKFNQMQKVRATLKYSFQDFLRYMFCCIKSAIFSKKAHLFKIANQKISKEMDIGWIMKKIQDIEKLKSILLNSDQHGIFNFVPPQIISTSKSVNGVLLNKKQIINEQDTEIIENSLQDLCQDLRQYYRHFDMYTELKKNSDFVSKNLLSSLHPEIVDIFDCIEKDIANQKNKNNAEEVPDQTFSIMLNNSQALDSTINNSEKKPLENQLNSTFQSPDNTQNYKELKYDRGTNNTSSEDDYLYKSISNVPKLFSKEPSTTHNYTKRKLLPHIKKDSSSSQPNKISFNLDMSQVYENRSNLSNTPSISDIQK